MNRAGRKDRKSVPEKKRDAREKGEVLKSTDLNTALMLFLLFGTLKLGTTVLRAHAGICEKRAVRSVYPAGGPSDGCRRG